VSNFVAQALRGEPSTVYGAGTLTSSFCHVADLVDGLVEMNDADVGGPVNLGNLAEFSLNELTEIVQTVVGVASGAEYLPLPRRDSHVRSPEISRFIALLGRSPAVNLAEGLECTVAWLAPQVAAVEHLYVSR
jgi:nucleoside-diphosphate-sugar epimerase